MGRPSRSPLSSPAATTPAVSPHRATRPLTPIPPSPSRADLCAEALRTRILAGELPPGHRLPPERQLAETLGVTRVTLRGALARLAQEQLLVARQGSGHTVRDYREAGGAALIPTLLDQLETPELRLRALEDLLEVRRHLARLVFARLLSRVERERHTARLEDALTAIATAIDAMAALPGDAPPAAIASADAAIIRALCAATDRPVLPLLVSPTVALVHASPPLRDAIYREPESHAAGWRQALAALRGRAALPATDSPPGPILDALESLMARRDAITLARIAGRDTVPSTIPNDATPAPTPRRRAR